MQQQRERVVACALHLGSIGHQAAMRPCSKTEHRQRHKHTSTAVVVNMTSVACAGTQT